MRKLLKNRIFVWPLNGSVARNRSRSLLKKKKCCYPRSLLLTVYYCFQESENYSSYLIYFDFCDVCFSNLTTICNILHRKEVQWWCGNVITRNSKSLIVSQNNLYGMYANFIVTFIRALDRASYLIC